MAETTHNTADATREGTETRVHVIDGHAAARQICDATDCISDARDILTLISMATHAIESSDREMAAINTAIDRAQADLALAQKKLGGAKSAVWEARQE